MLDRGWATPKPYLVQRCSKDGPQPGSSSSRELARKANDWPYPRPTKPESLGGAAQQTLAPHFFPVILMARTPLI